MTATPPQRQKPSVGAAMVWLFARFDGRIGREVFWLANIFLVAVLAVLLKPSVDPDTGEVAFQTGGIGFLLIVAAMVSSLAIGAKRLHDMNASGFLAVFLLVPLVSVLATVVLGVVPGTRGPNNYGERADAPPA
ncbi:MAG TPA: DUF805 domain-containing protein [Thermomicrobiales bacterium]|nr:DUF805 domain-containing protein [Thermomicrobiales bacterium]